MLRILAALLFVSLIPTGASAQQLIYNFNRATVFRAMQCEIGLFATDAKGKGLGEAMKAHVKYATTGSKKIDVSAEAGFDLGKIFQGPKLGAGYSFEEIGSATLDGTLNINKGNTATCVGKKKNVPAFPVGIRKCLKDGLEPLQNGFTVTCTNKVNAKATFTASGKFIAWVVTIGPSIEGDVVVSYQIDIDAPAKEEKKEEKTKPTS